MGFSRRTAQLLHEEHRTTITMIEELENMIARAKRSAPDVKDPQIQKILEQVNTTIEQDIHGHFAFEEQELFTRLAQLGDEDIGQHLKQEHDAMLPICQQLAALSQAAMADGFDDQSWSQFRSLTGELVERMLAHIQKEEMALLPMLDELLDPQTDMELAELYSMNQ